MHLNHFLLLYTMSVKLTWPQTFQLVVYINLFISCFWSTGNSWRPPDLQEVIDYLSHPNTQVKANAAAYLQHLCYTDQDVKVKTR